MPHLATKEANHMSEVYKDTTKTIQDAKGVTSRAQIKAAKFFTASARVVLSLAFLALLSAWIAASRDGSFLGFSEQHLFNDAIVLSLLGIAGLLDGILHRQGI